MKHLIIFLYLLALSQLVVVAQNSEQVNDTSLLVIPCQWDWVDSFSEGLAVVRDANGKHGFIDKTGKIVIPCQFASASKFYEGLAGVLAAEGELGFIDKTGKIVISGKWKEIGGFSEGLTRVKDVSGKYGIIDKMGNVIVPYQLDGVGEFFEDRALVKGGKKGLFGFMDKTGKIVIPCKWYDAYPFSESLACVQNRKGKWGFIDKTGKTVIPCKWFEAHPFSEGLAQVRGLGKSLPGDIGGFYRMGYIDKTGKVMIPCQWFDAGPFSDDMAWVEDDYYKYGFIDKTGKIVIPYQFANEKKFSEGLAWVYVAEGELGFMDKTGKIVISGKWKEIRNFSEGLAPVKDGNDKWGFIKNPLINENITGVATIKWEEYSLNSTIKSYKFKIVIKSDSKVEDVSVYVNGTLTRGILPVKADGNDMTLERTIELNEGENIIKVTVKNASGTATAEKTVTYQNQSIPTIDWMAFNPSTTDKQYALKAGIKSSSKIESSTVTLNGVIVDGVVRGINSKKDDGYDMMIEKMLTLAEGNNTIKIEVRNAGGVATTEKNVTYTKQEVRIRESRLALVIGNSAYPEQALPNPKNDATDIAAKLKNLGFDVILKTDLNHENMDTYITDFCEKSRNYDVALFFYAGHGIQSKKNNNNYLIPIDAKLASESRLTYECVNLGTIMDGMEEAGSKMRIIILDACRNTPFERRWHRGVKGAGLADMNASGTLIAYSTNPGNVALDGEGRNSPYTAGLLKMIDEENVPIELFFKNVRRYVKQQTHGAQEPWESSSLEGDFYFNRK